MKVVHITAHLGGGVGRALSSLVKYSPNEVDRVILCLEPPEKDQFINEILGFGVKVITSPSLQVVRDQVRRADIVQLEWWNHPKLLEYLVRLGDIKARLIVWSHVSGLYSPLIPEYILRKSSRFVFTSICSLEIFRKKKIGFSLENTSVISSAGDMSLKERSFEGPKDNISVGYIGSLNFSKLHPEFTDYVGSLDKKYWPIEVFGDPVNRGVLENRALDLNKIGLFNFNGYTQDVESSLARMDVLSYLLNPVHYGTTENALLEAMAFGVIPIVLDNPAELSIVEDGVNGVIVRSAEEFKSAISALNLSLDFRERLSRGATNYIKTNHRQGESAKKFLGLYEGMLREDPRSINFTGAFGSTPDLWFTACQESSIFKPDGRVQLDLIEEHSIYALYEKSKGSVFHFLRYFPDNKLLNLWASSLNRDKHDSR